MARSKVLHVRVTPETEADVKKLANLDCRTISDWCAQAIVKASKRKRASR